MISRRDLIKWGAVAPALAGTPHLAHAMGGQPMDAFVIDSRYGPAADLAGGVPLYRIDGDVTALWYQVLDPVWRRPGFVLGGITGADALFVLEVLARHHGRRVVARNALPASSGVGEGAIGWVIAPVHPSVKV